MKKRTVLIIVICSVCLLGIALAVILSMHNSSEFPKLSKWKQSRIESTWESLGHGPMHWAGSSTESGNRYYGCYEGYDIFFSEGMTQAVSGISIGSSYFGHSSGFSLYAYRNGKIVDLKDLYGEGKISDRSVAAAAKYHRAFERAFWTERIIEHNERFPDEPRNEIPSWATEPTE